MVASSQPDRYQFRRRLGESSIGRVGRFSTEPARHTDRHLEPPPRGGLDIEGEVAQTIESIERVVDNFSSLKDNFRFYEELVDDLRSKLDEEKEQRETFDREVAELQRRVKAEAARAAQAESSAKASEARARDLEDQLASLRSQTMRLVKAVTLLISTEGASRESDPDRALRLVS